MCFRAPGAAASLETILGTPARWSGQRPRRRRPIILLCSQYVTNREPVWAERDAMPVVTGLRVDRRELVGTSVTDAQPETRESRARPLDLAFPCSRRDHCHADRFDLYALGCGLGNSADRGHFDWMVLAQGRKGGR